MINANAIYVIALPERRYDITRELCKHDIEHLIMPAVKDENGIKGLQLSIEKVFTEAIDWGYKNVMVIEDDAQVVIPSPSALINKCISELPFDYDCLQFGANMVRPPLPYSENLFKVVYTHATHASLYSKKAMLNILSVLDYKTHLDALIHKYLQSAGNCYCSKQMIFNQKDGYSFIEKRETRYGSMMKHKFKQMTGHL